MHYMLEICIQGKYAIICKKICRTWKYAEICNTKDALNMHKYAKINAIYVHNMPKFAKLCKENMHN